MIKTVIIEDERLIAEEFRRMLLKTSGDTEIIGSFSTVKESVDYLSTNEAPDLIFSDVQLPDGLSFDIFNQVDIKSPVVFVTGYDNFILNAFECNGIDYLLKPVEPRRLADAVEKLKRAQSGAPVERINHHHEPNGILSENDQVFVKDGERCWFVKLSEVRLFESVGNYAKVFFGTNKPLILKSLNALEERLDEKVFFRANRKHIVNLRMIDKIEPYFNGGLLLELKGGEKIEVSRRQTVKFKEMMSL